MQIGFLITTLDILWKILKLYGHDPAAIFQNAGVSYDDLHQKGKRIPLSIMDGLWQDATTRIEDPCFGLKASLFWHPSHLNALGYAWLASRTLNEAFHRLERYWKVIGQQSDIKTVHNENSVSIVYKDRSVSIERYARIDAVLACIILMCRINYGEILNPVSVTLERIRPDCHQAYTDFFKSEIIFESDRNSISISKPCAEKKLISGDRQMAGLYDRIIEKYLNQFDSKTISLDVKESIISQLPSGNISKSQVAESLNMSVRTLQRKLKQEKTTFKALLEETRMEMAKQYLSESGNDLAEISFLLGFSQPSSFSRAFKRWTTISPHLFRKDKSASKSGPAL